MGQTFSQIISTGYDKDVIELAEKYQVGYDAVNEVYNRFNMASQKTKHIQPDVFHQLFLFTTKLARDNMDNFCNVTSEGCDFPGFFKLFQALKPQYRNKDLADIIFRTFQTDKGLFDAQAFMTELKSNLFFTHEGSQASMENFLFGKSNKSTTLTKEQYDELTKEPDSYILLYGRQLIFGSFIFQ